MSVPIKVNGTHMAAYLFIGITMIAQKASQRCRCVIWSVALAYLLITFWGLAWL